MSSKIHITVAGVIAQNDRFLMVEETSSQRLVLNQPGGHLEPHETLEQAVIREVREESAWKFQPLSLIGIYSWVNPVRDELTIRFAYHGDVTEYDAQQSLDIGIERTLWLSGQELKDNEDRLRNPLVLACLHDYLNNKRYPLEVVKNLDLHQALRYAVAV